MTEQDDRMTIGVFARTAKVSTSALRFYDDCGLVRPHAVDPITGYRYYSPNQLDEVTLIRQLRKVGLPLGEVRRVLAGPTRVAEQLLAAHLSSMERAVEDARVTLTTALTLIRDREDAVLAWSGQLLAEAIGQVASAADPGAGIPALGGVLIEATQDELRLVATDRYRLTVRSLPTDRRQVPGAAVVDAVQLDGARPWIGNQEHLQLGYADSCVHLTGPGGHRRLPTVAKAFPAYRIVLDGLPEVRTQVVAPRDLLLAAIADDPQVRLDCVVNGDLTVTSSSCQAMPRAVPADITGAPVAISFRSATLYPALAAASIGPDVMLQISQSHLPAVLRCADDGDITTVVMPVKNSSHSEPEENRGTVANHARRDDGEHRHRGGTRSIRAAGPGPRRAHRALGAGRRHRRCAAPVHHRPLPGRFAGHHRG